MDKSQINKDAVTQKILATTLETERLKQELEALIAQGIRGRAPITENPSHPPQLLSTNNVQIIKSYDPEHSQHPKDELKTLSPKKPKTCDLKGVRDYIKKQRSKRMEELKTKKSSTQVAADIRKEKLKELQQKANEIVKKNVQAKRARSKSREPPIVRSRSVSRVQQPLVGCRSRSQDHIVIESSNCAQKSPIFKANGDHHNKNPNLLYPPETKYGFQKLNQENGQIIRRSDLGEKKPNLEVPESLNGAKNRSSSSQTSRSTSEAQKLLHPEEINQPISAVHSNITVRNIPDPVSPTISEGVKRIPDWLKEQQPADPYNFINTVKRQLKYAVNQTKPGSVDVGVQGNLDDLISPLHSGNKTDLKSFISHKCLNLDSKAIQHIELNRDQRICVSKDGPTVTKLSSCSENDSNTSKNIPSISSESGSSLRRNAEFVRQSSYNVSDLRLLENGPPNLDCGPLEDVQLKDTHRSLSRLSRSIPEEVEKIRKQLFKDSDQYSSDFVETDVNKRRQSPNRVPEIIFDIQGPSRSITEDISTNIASENSVIIKSSLQKPRSDFDFVDKSHNKSRDSIISFNSASLSPNRVLDVVSSTNGANSSQLSNTISKERRPISDVDSLQFGSLVSTLCPSSINSQPNVLQNTDSTNSKSGPIVTSESLNQHESQKVQKTSLPFSFHPSNSNSQLNYQNTDSQGSKSEQSQRIRSSKSVTSESLNLQGSLQEQAFQKADGKLDNKCRTLSKSEPHIFVKDKTVEDPKLSFTIKKKSREAGAEERDAVMKNITIRSGDVNMENFNNSNEIKVKFQAEIHLLTDFNESIRRFSEIEKAFQSLRTQNNPVTAPTESKAVQNRDTQTSERSNNVNTASQQPTILSEKNLDAILSLNLDSALTTVNFEDSLLDSDKTSSLMRFSNLDESLATRVDVGEENVLKSIAGMSLRMCDQLIRDEDIRIENWKKVIKIREQTLLDRTKGELAWLEVQKKQLIETGNLAEASLLKKKQRGILLKHQQEKHEMQRLKQMQKEDSHDRKALLKKERNQIKKQLLSGAMLSKLKPVNHRERYERRLSGPFKVIQASGTTTVLSETSLSKGTAGTDQEFKSITTRTSRTHSMVNILSETSDGLNMDQDSLDLISGGRANISAGAVSNMKKKLLMREHALAKRRKTVEELLQWHKKLLDEEKAIEELENKIGTIVSKIPSENNDKSPKKSSVASSNLSAEETSATSMSKFILERLQAQASTLTTTPKTETPISSENTTTTTKNIPQEEVHSEDSNRVATSANYSTDFEIDTAPKNSDDQSSVSSISQLIEDFSKIEDNILNLMSRRQSPVEDEIIPSEEGKSEVSSQSTEVTSQIEANKIDSEQTQQEEVLSEIQDIIVSETGDSELITVSDYSTIANNSSLVSEATQQEVELIDTIKDQIETNTAPEESIAAEQEISVESEAIEQTLTKDESEEPTNISTSKQYEEIEDFVVSNLEQPSTSTQQDSPALSEQNNSISAPSLSNNRTNDIQAESSNIVDEDRQSFENKTDEEKAASLSNTQMSLRQNEIKDGESNKEEDSIITISTDEKPSFSSNDNSNISFEVDSSRTSTADSSIILIDDSPNKSFQPKSSTDIRKPVQDILNASSPLAKGDKSPRTQDLCLMTHDTSPIHSPESVGSPLDERKQFSLGSEAEELHRKQLAIEQEIKLLKEQQKEAATPFYVREIPNKPPPPYTPPTRTKSPKTPSVIPGGKEEIDKITEYSAKIIHKAYLSSNLDNITISDNTLNLIAKNIDKGCFKFVFDICKEIAKDHYSQFVEEAGPSWLQCNQKQMLVPIKPLDVNGLKDLMNKKLLEIFGFEKQEIKRENTIMSRKKRDHVDEVLLQEMVAEEISWTNFDRDEVLVKDQVTNEIMEMLLTETAQELRKTMEKKFENQ